MRTYYRGWEIMISDYYAIARKGGIVLEKNSSPKMDIPLLPAIKWEIDRVEGDYMRRFAGTLVYPEESK